MVWGAGLQGMKVVVALARDGNGMNRACINV